MSYLIPQPLIVSMPKQKSEDLARERAPTRNEFHRMLRGVEENLSGEMRLQCKFALYTMGELGLRAGELTHMKKDWVNLHEHKIEIPEWSRCNCSYCRKRAKSEAKRNDDLSLDEAMRKRWKPKNPASQRTVYFHYNTEIVELCKKFFNLYEEWPTSRATVNRRVDRIVENSAIDREISSINPESLRAAAATYHANLGINPKVLTEMMGWQKEETALKFLRSTSDGQKSELSEIHDS